MSRVPPTPPLAGSTVPDRGRLFLPALAALLLAVGLVVPSRGTPPPGGRVAAGGLRPVDLPRLRPGALSVPGVPASRATAPVGADTLAAPVPILLERAPVRPRSPAAAAATSRVDAPPGDGSHLLLCTPGSPPRLRLLTPEMAAAGRPDLSADAQRVLFVGRRAAGDRTSVWERELASGALREVVRPPRDCSAAIYLSTVYTMHSEAPVPHVAFVSPDGVGTPQLFTCTLDGQDIRQITFAPHGARSPLLLSDGRLLFQGWTGGGGGGTPRPAIFSVNVDGADLARFSPTTGEEARLHRLDDEHFAASMVPSGSIVTYSRFRSGQAVQRLSIAGSGAVIDPAPWVRGSWLVSWRRTPGDPWRLARWNRDPHSSPEPLFAGRGAAWHERLAIAVRPRPRAAGRSSSVDDRSDRAFLYCLDVTVDESWPDPGSRPAVPARLRIVRWLAEGTEELLGEIPVERDGSFSLQLPPRTPLRFETIREDGTVARAMNSWVWLMPREARGCIGCHEDRALTPPNRHVFALRRLPFAVGVPTDVDLPHGTAPSWRLPPPLPGGKGRSAGGGAVPGTVSGASSGAGR